MGIECSTTKKKKKHPYAETLHVFLYSNGNICTDTEKIKHICTVFCFFFSKLKYFKDYYHAFHVALRSVNTVLPSGLFQHDIMTFA